MLVSATHSRELPKASFHNTLKVELDAVDRNTLRAGPRPAGAGLTMAGLRGKPLIAYLVVCVFWGSTYLAIRVGVGVLPPFLFAGLRFLVGGVLLLGVALALGDRLPRRAGDWRTSAIVGRFLLSGGNAFVVWAEQFTASGIASIFVVTVALWMAFFDAIIPGGSGDLSWRVVAGLLLGFAGTALLVGAPETAGGTNALIATGLLALMAVTWSIAAILSSRTLARSAPIATVAAGTWVGSLVLAPFAATEIGLPVRWSTESLLAFGYLVIFGSCVGLVLNLWLYRKLRPTTASLTQVLIPAQAILIGTLWLGEPLSWRMFGGAALVVSAVLLNALAGGSPAAVAAETPAAAG